MSSKVFLYHTSKKNLLFIKSKQAHSKMAAVQTCLAEEFIEFYDVIKRPIKIVVLTAAIVEKALESRAI